MLKIFGVINCHLMTPGEDLSVKRLTYAFRYTYRQAVKGTVTLSGQVAGFSWLDDVLFKVKKTANVSIKKSGSSSA